MLLMKKSIFFGLLGFSFLLGGYRQSVVRAETRASSAPATDASNSALKIKGIHTGMTVARSKAAIPGLSCTSSTVKGELLTQCEAVQRNQSVAAPWMEIGVYHGRVYSVTWYCMNSAEGCDSVIKLMYSHF